MPNDLGWPEPFPDVVADLRSSGQQSEDAPRRQEQVDLLVGVAGLTSEEDTLVDILRRRREDAGEDVVRLEVAETGRDRPTAVVPRELLLREGGRDSTAALRTLEEAGFSRARFADSDVGCEELLGRVSPFTAPEGTDIDYVRRTAERLAQEGFSAAPSAVMALHQIPRSRIVVKAGAGPARTEVRDDPEIRMRGFHEPSNGVLVAVIDTGIADIVRKDRWLNEVPRSPDSIDPLDAFPAVAGQPAGNGKLDFAAGHGTFAAGIVRQIDPEAQIRCYAALDSDGFATEFAVACAMIRAVKDGAQVINLSLGMHSVDNQPCLALEVALDVIEAMSEGSEPPVLVASAGNYGTRDPVWPAASRRVVSVAGLTAALQPATWSSRGTWVDCSTVAEGIVSTFVMGEEDPEFGGNESYPLDAWAVWVGTSFAAPQIAGATSRMCRELGLSPREAARRIIRLGRAIPDFGRAVRLLPGT
jgi:hypothetical protein